MNDEQRYKELFANMSEGVAIYEAVDDGQDFVFVDYNRAGQSMDGVLLKDAIGKKVTEVYPGVKDFGLFEVFQRVWRTGVPERHPVSLYRDDKLAFYRSNYVYKLPSGLIVAVYSDETKRKQVEEEKARLEGQYQQAQKVESIGRLAGGVAHDLNNLLAPIIGYGEIMMHEFGPDDKYHKYADEIVEAGFRARDLVHQLLAFSRKQNLEYKSIDINKAVLGFEKLLRRTIPEDIKLKILPSAGILMVMADVGQIEQVLMNLAVNAADAMPDGGRLTIEIVPSVLDEDSSAVHPEAQPGEYVMLAVSDTGHGFDDETRKHLFEPFYSTKGDKGTGLGLATVYGIVKQHGGNIWAYSELGSGTTFKVYLPVTHKAYDADDSDHETTLELTGTETILLVEDNLNVRNLAKTILELQGYSVLVAENGYEALNILRAHDGPLQLLFTDVVMPKMNGKELFSKALEKFPGLKVLYMSGYTDDVIAHRGVLEDGTAFIQKPFNIQTLAAKVRKVLDK
jgi:two-component system, cell cycle sensor histidine kinase and response regulator CckA